MTVFSMSLIRKNLNRILYQSDDNMAGSSFKYVAMSMHLYLLVSVDSFLPHSEFVFISF